MTTLEIISFISNLLLAANCWWLLYLLHKKNLLIDKLIAIVNNESKTIYRPDKDLMDRLNKIINKEEKGNNS